jgi:antitoxin VapB
MALNIKNAATEQASRRLSELTGESITTAVTVAVRERLARLEGEQDSTASRVERMMAIAAETGPVLRTSPLTIDDLYDEHGLPE